MYDLRYAIRSLVHAPGFAAAAILTLAIAIGANTAMFSILYGVVLQPLAFQHPERVMRVFETDKHNASFREGASMPDFEDWKAQQRVFSRIAGMTTRTANITEANAEAEQVTGLGVSHDFFALLGVKPILGRAFLPGDDGRRGDPWSSSTKPCGAAGAARRTRSSAARSCSTAPRIRSSASCRRAPRSPAPPRRSSGSRSRK